VSLASSAGAPAFSDVVAESTAGPTAAGKRLAGAVTVGGYRAGSLLARMVPGVVASGLANPIGFGANVVNPQRRAMIERHLRRVNPTWSRLRLRAAVQDAFESYARYWVESLRLPSLSARTVAAGIDVTNYEHIAAARAEGTGVILALPHLGGWEWAGRWLADRGDPVTVVVERIEPPELFDWFAELRAKLGMTVVGLGADAGRATLQALKRNEIVCLLSDRNIGGGGVDVEFFGEHTKLPAGPATLALRTGAPILPVAVYFTRSPDGHLGVVRPPLAAERRGALREDVSRITQHLAAELEHLIRRAPEQWHLFQPNWPSDPGYGE
jgi:phosphatidylinositol dimannoside acyltransferase